jgi:hypothetical protein
MERMTAPKLEQMKYWIVKPFGGYNYIKNPRFDPPAGIAGWYISGVGVTIESTGNEARWGAYSMRVNTASGVASGAYYANLSVTNLKAYTFSFYIKATAGQTFNTDIHDASWVSKGNKKFTATGYWQRVEVTFTAAENSTEYKVQITRDAIASTDPFYVDGAQFEQASKATTFIHGYGAGCGWEGLPRNSTSWRDPTSAKGGILLCINDYAKVITSYGLGMGDWNQIMTKMTSGGDMYQTHIRKSRNFTLVLAYSGDNQGELQANRKVILDALRPDLAEGQTRIIRYQGFDANGNEATNPIDIACVFQSSHNDIPDMPMFQKDVLNFTIPSGLLQGAYNEGKELDLYANFPAEFIVKRDKDGNWCKWNADHYDSLITGLNVAVYCMAESPDGKIYAGGAFSNAGGIATADYLARWNPITEAWEAVVAGINNTIFCMAFDANGDLYIGGGFTDLGSANGDRIVKISALTTANPVITALGTGLDSNCFSIAIGSNGDIYAGGAFTLAGGVANTVKIAKWNGTVWSPLSTGLNDQVSALKFAPNGDLYIGGAFTDAAYPYLCKWNGTEFSVVGTNTDINAVVYTIAFGATGYLYVGGEFTNAGGVANADYIVKWNGSQWESLGSGVNGIVRFVYVNSGKVYASGAFTTAGGLTLTDRVAVWSNGAWQPLDINLPGSASVYAVLPASDGSLYIGGAFSTVAGDPDENAKTGLVVLNLNVTSASANTYPFIQIHGPGTLKAITNYNTGKSVMFDGLTLQVGEWINLSFDPLDLQFKGGWEGRGNLMRYVVPGSDYGDFYLKPGTNYLSLFMTDTDANTNAFTFWTPLFWGLDGALL